MKIPKEAIELGAIVLGAAALAYFVFKSAGPSQQASDAVANSLPQPAQPNYLTYNLNNPNSVPATNLAKVPTYSASGEPSPTCSCGTGAANVYYSSSQAWQQSLQDQLGGFLSDYENQVQSQFPDFVSQFFNNTYGVQAETASQTKFASVAGL